MRTIFFVLAVLTFLFVSETARAAYTPPARTGFITDPGNELGAPGAEAISAKLARYQACSTNEIAVFLPTSLDGNPIEDVAYTTFNTWKLGLAAKDNGVLLVIAKAERKAFIATGKGVGGDLPDIEAFQILRHHVTPNMKGGYVFRAIDEGTTAIGKALGGCAMTESVVAPPPPPSSPTVLLIERIGFGSLVFLFGFSLGAVLGGARRGRIALGAVAAVAFLLTSFRNEPLDLAPVFLAPLLLANIISLIVRNARSGGGGGSSSSTWTGSDGGSSSSSGSSGGGGGGSTGGGGAGDSW